MYKYNSRVHKTPFGAVRAGEKIKIVFPVTHPVWVESVKMFLRKGEDVWERLLSFCGDDGNITYFCTEFTLNEWGVYLSLSSDIYRLITEFVLLKSTTSIILVILIVWVQR